MISPALRAVRDALTAIEEREPVVTFELPLRLDSAANGSQGASLVGRIWRAKQVRDVRGVVRAAATTAIQKQAGVHATWLLKRFTRVVVLVTRVAPRALDRHDNLPRASKAVYDGVADALGLKSDRTTVVEFVCDQERRGAKEYAVRVEIHDGR